MTTRSAALSAFLAANADAVVCELTAVRGSSPRAQGTFMLVAATDLFGTIGGGALEYMVIEHARRLIANGQAEEAMDVPLGPEIGQCCGGRVELTLDREPASPPPPRPAVLIFGAGHVGRALARDVNAGRSVYETRGILML